MKLEDLKRSIEDKGVKKRIVNNDYRNRETKGYSLDSLKIIGITGSVGKSTTAFLIHKYLLSLGKRSILYSSIMVDSPASIISKDEAFENACRDEKALLSIISEAEKYEAEYLVLEVNESTLEKGILKDVPFAVRVLTNIIPAHNLIKYSESEYVSIKKLFFSNITDSCKCVLCFQNYSKELLEELIKINNYPKIICTNKYIAEKFGIDLNSIDYLLVDCQNKLDGLFMKINGKDSVYSLNTNLCMFYNAMNIMTFFATINALELYDEKVLTNVLNKIQIPGRTEIIRANGRIIIIDTHLPRVLENLKEFKDNGEIKKIKVVIGSVGYGFKTWSEHYKTEKYIQQHHSARKYAVELLNPVADYVCFTESDSGAEDTQDICLELKGYLKKSIESNIIVDRRDAIKNTIKDSQDGDAIFIAGRGNRKILCNGYDSIKLLKDSDIVKDILIEFGWLKDENL